MPDRPDEDPAPAAQGPGGEPEAAPPLPGDGRAGMSRRTFLVESAALVAAGTVLGAGAVIVAESAGGHPQAAGTPPPGTSPAPAGSAAPAGILPPAPGASEEPIEEAPPAGLGRVIRENLLRGSARWELPLSGTGNAEAYAGDVSVTAGDRLAFHVSTGQGRVRIVLYRLGWYGALGGRAVARWRDVVVQPQPRAVTEPHTGLIRADWAPAVTAAVPDGWVSGLYLAVVGPDGGAPQYCTFVVREPEPVAPILFVSSATTHQAYNAWGGKSLYPDESTGAATVSGDTNAVIASWDRPYADYRGAGLVLRWEYPFVRWLESRGYDVAYMADLDLERHPEQLAGRRLVVFAGHPEYWSIPMRLNLEAAIGTGTNVAFFAANEVYWRVRYEEGPGGRYRTVTCYRRAEIDPLAASDPVHATTKWRDAPAPNPECRLCGQMYGHMVLTPADFVCAAPDHWVFDGTGMKAGDRIANLIGQEYDRCFEARTLLPPGTKILASSPVRPNLGHEVSIYGPVPPDEPSAPVHNATIYTAPSGATVFSAGTMQWSWALDGWGSPTFEGIGTPLDRRAARITANILDRLSA